MRIGDIPAPSLPLAHRLNKADIPPGTDCPALCHLSHVLARCSAHPSCSDHSCSQLILEYVPCLSLFVPNDSTCHKQRISETSFRLQSQTLLKKQPASAARKSSSLPGQNGDQQAGVKEAATAPVLWDRQFSHPLSLYHVWVTALKRSNVPTLLQESLGSSTRSQHRWGQGQSMALITAMLRVVAVPTPAAHPGASEDAEGCQDEGSGLRRVFASSCSVAGCSHPHEQAAGTSPGLIES